MGKRDANSLSGPRFPGEGCQGKCRARLPVQALPLAPVGTLFPDLQAYRAGYQLAVDVAIVVVPCEDRVGTAVGKLEVFRTREARIPMRTRVSTPTLLGR